VGRRTIKRGAGKRAVEGKDFRLAEEIDYIQGRAAAYDGRFVTVGPLALFSTETGDAWLLDPTDHLAARIARDGDPEEIYFEETETNFAIGWKGTKSGFAKNDTGIRTCLRGGKPARRPQRSGCASICRLRKYMKVTELLPSGRALP